MSKIGHVLLAIQHTICRAVCFQFTHFPCDDWENIYTLSYYHHLIGSKNYYPLFRVRSWNNGMRCMFFIFLFLWISNYNLTYNNGFDYWCMPCLLLNRGLSRKLNYVQISMMVFWPGLALFQPKGQVCTVQITRPSHFEFLSFSVTLSRDNLHLLDFFVKKTYTHIKTVILLLKYLMLQLVVNIWDYGNTYAYICSKSPRADMISSPSSSVNSW